MPDQPKLNQWITEQRTEEVEVPTLAVDETGVKGRGTTTERRTVREKVAYASQTGIPVCAVGAHDFARRSEGGLAVKKCRRCPIGRLSSLEA